MSEEETTTHYEEEEGGPCSPRLNPFKNAFHKLSNSESKPTANELHHQHAQSEGEGSSSHANQNRGKF